ncbi:cyclophilin-like fold protein [Streptomyces sp. NBC_00286]|uniref:cyclophilin-like fold protein n=1 Tax=Streptomyces sp. NBC_00286 TaxID=2975701 RepID=UPI002E2ADD85|nr:cyclophilin-like fold protein [Streptomyces sp. NBC_00286]
MATFAWVGVGSVLARAAATAALLLTATACTQDSSPSSAPPEQTTASSAPERAATAPAPSTASGRNAMNIRITIDGTPVEVTLNDSATARDLADQLPLELTLTDFHQAEKIADLSRPLSTSGAPQGADPRVGDLAYYAPWGQLVTYYRDAPYADGLIILGHLPDSATEQLAAADEVPVTIEPAS